jgi:propanol-preferring alcohol dehydrogenase
MDEMTKPPTTMNAMVLESPGKSLKACQLPVPSPGTGQVLVRVDFCGVCRTDLHVMDGELAQPKLPLIPGHEIVGEVVATGGGVTSPAPGRRVGIPWLGRTCRSCEYCKSDRENLCNSPVFTGYQHDGGYSRYTVADADYCFPLPDGIDGPAAAPLLCAGLIGWRSYKMTGGGRNLGLYGFGAAAHIIAQVAVHRGQQIFAFTRSGDSKGQEFARSLGAAWAGDSDKRPPEPLDAAIIFAPVGALVPEALKSSKKGGIIVLGGIHMSDIPQFSYSLLWEERQLRSVANLTRADAREFLEIAPRVPVKTSVTVYRLAEANKAIADIRAGKIHGAAVLDTSD